MSCKIVSIALTTLPFLTQDILGQNLIKSEMIKSEMVHGLALLNLNKKPKISNYVSLSSYISK